LIYFLSASLSTEALGLGDPSGGKLHTLGNGALELREHLVEILLLKTGKLTDRVDLDCTLLAELNLRRKERDLGNHIRLHVGALNNASGAAVGLEKGSDEAISGGSHGEGGRACAVLGLDNLITAELNAVGQSSNLLVAEALGGLHVGEEGEDGDASVATNNGNLDASGVDALGLCDEGLGTEDIKGGDTKELFGVVDAVLLEDLRGDRDRRVDRVGNDEDAGVGAVLGASFDQGRDDAGVGVEEVITGPEARRRKEERQVKKRSHHSCCHKQSVQYTAGTRRQNSHAGLAGDTSGDDDDVGILESGCELLTTLVAGNLGLGGDVREVSCHAGGVDHIVQSKLSDLRMELHKHGQRLSDTTGGAEDCDLEALRYKEWQNEAR
jgi:hypothetical protein